MKRYDIIREVGVKKYNHNHDPATGRFTTGSGGPSNSGGSDSFASTHGGTTKEEGKKYMDAVKAGDMETARRMVEEKALRVGAETFTDTETPAYKIRTGPEPKKTITVYKTFFVDEEGNPSALFIEGTNPLPVDVWLDAQDAYHFMNPKNGKLYTPSRKNPNSDGSGKTGQSIPIPNDEVRQELIDRGFLPEGSTAKNVTALAYRPGWHAGDLPFFPQGGKQGNPRYNEDGTPNKRFDPSLPETNYPNIHRRNQVVFECEMIADEDFTNFSEIKSGENKGKLRYTDMQTMPTDGFYKFATNPLTNSSDLGSWYISGSLKIKRALSEEECNEILRKNGFKPQEWEGGGLDLDKLNYNPDKSDRNKKLLESVTYDNDGKIIPLSERFNPNITDVRKNIPQIDIIRHKCSRKRHCIDSIIHVKKYNHNHDPETGRFTSGPGGSVTSGNGTANINTSAGQQNASQGNSDGSASTSTRFTPAKTIEEARTYAKEQLGFKYVDFSYMDLTNGDVKTFDIETVNHINETITAIQEKYPELKGVVKRLGVAEFFGADRYAQYIVDGKDFQQNSLEFGKPYREGLGNVKEFFMDDVEIGFHPEGVDYDSIIWHEYGHVYADILRREKAGYRMDEYYKDIRSAKTEKEWIESLFADKEYADEWDRDWDIQQFPERISKYAMKNSAETFAEAFAEYNCSKTPRPECIALVERAMKERAQIEEQKRKVYRERFLSLTPEQQEILLYGKTPEEQKKLRGEI